MKSLGPIALALSSLLLAASPASAVIISVTSGQSLQQAIDNASNGDTIQVGPGTYPAEVTGQTGGRVEFHIWKSLVVRSTSGPGSTTLTRSGGTSDQATV